MCEGCVPRMKEEGPCACPCPHERQSVQECMDCHHPLRQVTVFGGGRISQTARLVVRNPKGEKETQTDVRGSHSHRFVWKDGKALQLAFDDTNKFSHLDCKACDSNPWWARDGTPPSSKYEIALTGPNLWHIKCKHCGWEYDSG